MNDESYIASEPVLPVRVLQIDGQAALVEWTLVGDIYRAVVPVSRISAGYVRKKDLDAGIPFGIPWQDFEPAGFSGAKLARELRRAGIWTRADLDANPRVVIGVLQALYQSDVSALRNFAKQQE